MSVSNLRQLSVETKMHYHIPEGVILHTDLGSQYAGIEFIAIMMILSSYFEELSIRKNEMSLESS